MQLTDEQKKSINDLTGRIESDLLYIIEQSDAEDIDELSDEVDEQTNGFNVEIIYYARAMEYLTDNDPSLQDSLEIAKDMGFEVDKLNSELLASLLASQNEREAYEEIKDELAEILFPEVTE